MITNKGDIITLKIKIFFLNLNLSHAGIVKSLKIVKGKSINIYNIFPILFLSLNFL